jgi:asparagine synthetase B (glutamine-hydrolysing)
MCSILLSNKKDKALLQNANTYIKLRGPDHTSFYEAEGLTFIHNLLSITGDFITQPFIDHESNIVCIYNGEIYNAFNSDNTYKSDGECIIPLYKKYGKNFVKKLDGEYAIVLVDFKNKNIVLASDTFLTKPLWFGKNKNDFTIGTYKSSVELTGIKATRMKPNTCQVYDLEFNLLEEFTVYDFWLNQHKKTYDDWNTAFENSIKKRAANNVRENIFIGMSSGYDSGAIACELNKQKIKFTAYSVSGSENKSIIKDRFDIINQSADTHYLEGCMDEYVMAKKHVEKYVEPYTYEIFSNRNNYKEFIPLTHDGGANGLSLVCSRAIKQNKKIYISGSGADEIFSDYGWNGKTVAPHSNFGGLFPMMLESIFPWTSFYGSSQITYLTKEEMVGGSYGIECRYPFLDRQVVQEFLWLTAELKNKFYKNVLHNYMIENNFPHRAEKKGFWYKD